MKELTTIQQVAGQIGVSSRTLRYWESVGLYKSERDGTSGWRVYDEKAVKCIRVIILLRKLELCLKDVKQIIESRSADVMRHLLEQLMSQLDRQGSDLAARKEAVSALLQLIGPQPICDMDTLEQALLSLAEPQTLKNSMRIEEAAMSKIQSSGKKVRFLTLPAMRTVCCDCVDVAPEDKAMTPVLSFIEKNNLLGTMRLFGYNTAPYSSETGGAYGFGFCATIPEGVEIGEPLREKRLPGGLYAAMECEEDIGGSWKVLVSEIKKSDEYSMDSKPCMEEHFRNNGSGFVITLLLSVKSK